MRSLPLTVVPCQESACHALKINPEIYQKIEMGAKIKWIVSNLPPSLPKAYADTVFRLNELQERILVREFGKMSGGLVRRL